NPLGAIKASAQLLTEPAQGDEVPREFLDIIVEETDRLARVVGSFLDYAKPGAPDPEPIDLGHAVERTMRMLEAELAEHEIRWTLELDPDRKKVRVDAEHVRQILLNLVRNAIEAAGKGGRIHVEVERTQRKGVADALEDWMELRVTDDGPGIDPEILPKLFVPFVTNKPNGSGLGLAISQRLANAASGRIEVRGEKDRGTTFVVSYPGVREVRESTA